MNPVKCLLHYQSRTRACFEVSVRGQVAPREYRALAVLQSELVAEFPCLLTRLLACASTSRRQIPNRDLVTLERWRVEVEVQVLTQPGEVLMVRAGLVGRLVREARLLSYSRFARQAVLHSS